MVNKISTEKKKRLISTDTCVFQTALKENQVEVPPQMLR